MPHRDRTLRLCSGEGMSAEARAAPSGISHRGTSPIPKRLRGRCLGLPTLRSELANAVNLFVVTNAVIYRRTRKPSSPGRHRSWAMPSRIFVIGSVDPAWTGRRGTCGTPHT